MKKYNPFKPCKFIVFASEEAAKKEAAETGGTVDACKLSNVDGTPILDAGEPVIVYKVIY